MKCFHEYADRQILQDCLAFIQANEATVGDPKIAREALYLSGRLRDSLLESHRECDEFVREHTKDILWEMDDILQFIKIRQFNQMEVCLILDAAAHEIYDRLETIQRANARG